MRLLLVEDESSFADALKARLEQVVSDIDVVVAPGAAEAIAILDDDSLDFIVCDLRIPSDVGSADLDIAHGQSVVAAALDRVPGTPILVLSAFADNFGNLRELMTKAGREDVHGTGTPYVMVDGLVKDRVDEAVVIVQRYADELTHLDDVAVVPLDGSVLLPWEVRILRIFGRRSGGRLLHVHRLGGGLSPSHAYRVEVFDDRRDRRASVVGKLGKLDDVKDERQRLQREIAPRLVEGTYAPYADAVTGGCGSRGGLFCKLLEGFETPLLDLLKSGDPKAVAAIAAVRNAMRPWVDHAPWETVKVGDLRRDQISDEALEPFSAELRVLGASAFEARDVQVRAATQHADLHGLNVLMNGEAPQLVDYARVGPSVGGTDPMSLEFSLAFHPSLRGESWPSLTNAEAWVDPVAYAEGGPYGAVIDACRHWALEDAGSPRAAAAIGYSWALRQLKFDGTDPALALAIARAAIGWFNS